MLKYFCLYYSNVRQNHKNITQKIKHSFDKEISQLILMPFLPANVISKNGLERTKNKTHKVKM